jgi:replicative DNA helicase
LEADILATKADVVVVDPIYLMDYEANTSKVAGGDVANTSKRIRRLAGLTGAVIHVITQADEVKDDRDDEGNRELRPPKRAEIKKTKAVLEDAANVFGIDTLDGAGIIEIGKGRNGGEGTQVEVLYLPNYGIVREVETGEAAVSQFDF